VGNRAKNFESILGNILLKINSKLNKTNHVVLQNPNQKFKDSTVWSRFMRWIDEDDDVQNDKKILDVVRILISSGANLHVLLDPSYTLLAGADRLKCFGHLGAETWTIERAGRPPLEVFLITQKRKYAREVIETCFIDGSTLLLTNAPRTGGYLKRFLEAVKKRGRSDSQSNINLK